MNEILSMKDGRGAMKKWLNALLKILIITAAVTVVVVVIGLIARWQTPVQFSDGFFWAGVVLGGVGVLGSFGDKNMRFNAGIKYLQSPPQEKYSQLSGAEDETARVKRSAVDSGKSFNSYLLLFVSAILIILIGYLITIIF